MTARPLVSVMGTLVPHSEIEFPRSGVGLLRGYGVYETLYLYPGGLFQVDAHLARLADSVALLRIPMPDPAALRAALAAWTASHDLAWAQTRIVVLGTDGDPWWMIEGDPLGGPRPDVADRPLRMWLSEITVPPPPLGTAKTISRVSYELAGIDAKARGFDDALMPTVSGLVGESTRASVFWRRGQTVFTPPLSLGVLPGVTRSLVLRHLPDVGFDVEEAEMPFGDLRDADEVFVTSTIRGAAPVVSLSGPDGAETHLECGPAVRAADDIVMRLVDDAGLLTPRSPPGRAGSTG